MPPQRFNLVRGRTLRLIDELLEKPTRRQQSDGSWATDLEFALKQSAVDLFELSWVHGVTDKNRDKDHVRTHFLGLDGPGWWGKHNQREYIIAAYRQAYELAFKNVTAGQAGVGRSIRSLWMRGLPQGDFSMSIVDYEEFVLVVWITPEIEDEMTNSPIPQAPVPPNTELDDIWVVDETARVDAVFQEFQQRGYADVPAPVTKPDTPSVSVFNQVRY